jgi:multidrug resistance efflux pump
MVKFLRVFLTAAFIAGGCVAAAADKLVVRGMGYVRGRKRAILRNKFAGFVTKVNIYSQTAVKKGDVIIEYDDLDIRTTIEKLEHSITEQKKTIELKQIELELKKLDPLPSEYRKTQWKLAAAKKRLERHSHELEVYKKLHKSKSVSELQLREKEQEVKDAEAELKGYSDDLEKLQGGMANTYVQGAEKAVESAKVKLASLERELELAKEQLKYYRIVTPYDGICITNSDTLYAYDAVGTEAVEIHCIIPDEVCPAGKYVYAYFDENDLVYVQEGVKCRFRSNQYDCDAKGFAELLPFQVKKQRYSYGDKVLHLVKFRVMKETVPLRIDSTGFVEIEVPAR